MVTRLHTNPIVIFRSSVTETAANTFTQVAIELPVAILGAGNAKFQAVEFMHADVHMTNPSIEAGQSNNVQSQITRGLETALLNRANEGLILERDKSINSTEVTAVGEMVVRDDGWRRKEIAARDGKGMLIAERTIHHGIKGVGNASAEKTTWIMYGYLVSLTPDEIVAFFLEADD